MEDSKDLISRQAAVDWLKNEWDGMVVHVFDGIKNIPATHCDNCPYPSQHVPQEDAVSRKELKHIFETWLTVSGYNDAERNIIKAALYELQFAPSVMPVQRSFSCGQENDLISRQAAIDGVKTLHDVAWKNWHEPTLSANVVLDMIRELPSAQPEQRWIPCSERLPEENSDILVTYVEKDEKRIVPVNYGCGTWFDCFFNKVLNPVGVLAWMLPPESYREDGAGAERRTDDLQ